MILTVNLLNQSNKAVNDGCLWDKCVAKVIVQTHLVSVKERYHWREIEGHLSVFQPTKLAKIVLR